MRVCAPGLIPRKPADRVKTDARDAERLARLLAAGELAFVRVPSVEEEQLRDLVRAREDLRGDLSRARQRLSHLLRRRGLRYPGRGSAWTARHRSWLRGLSFADRASAVTFADYLAGVTALEQRRDSVDEALAELAPESPWADDRPAALLPRDRHAGRGRALRRGRRLRPLHPSAPAGCLPRPRALRAHLRRQAPPGGDHQGGPEALAPAAGRGSPARLAPPRVSDDLRRRQADQDPRVCEVAWRAQQRLYRQWHKLADRRGKHANVATVACARELAAFVWEAALIP